MRGWRCASIAAMPPTSQKYLIRSPKQMAALRAPTRQEIVDVLAPMGAASAAELAVALGRPADALYYHLRILRDVGLIVDAGERSTGTRREALYRTVGSGVTLSYEPGKRGNGKHVSPIIGAMLRLTERDFAQCLRDADTVVEGEQRELWAGRTTGWLTEQQLAGVNRHIARLLQASLKAPSPKGRLFGLTVVLTPLDHRARKTTSRAPGLAATRRKST